MQVDGLKLKLRDGLKNALLPQRLWEEHKVTSGIQFNQSTSNFNTKQNIYTQQTNGFDTAVLSPLQKTKFVMTGMQALLENV